MLWIYFMASFITQQLFLDCILHVSECAELALRRLVSSLISHPPPSSIKPVWWCYWIYCFPHESSRGPSDLASQHEFNHFTKVCQIWREFGRLRNLIVPFLLLFFWAMLFCITPSNRWQQQNQILDRFSTSADLSLWHHVFCLMSASLEIVSISATADSLAFFRLRPDVRAQNRLSKDKGRGSVYTLLSTLYTLRTKDTVGVRILFSKIHVFVMYRIGFTIDPLAIVRKKDTNGPNGQKDDFCTFFVLRLRVQTCTRPMYMSLDSFISKSSNLDQGWQTSCTLYT